MRQNIFPYLFLLIFFHSCADKKQTKVSTLSGNFPALAGEMLYLEELEPLKAVRIDSATIDESGFFEFVEFGKTGKSDHTKWRELT